MSVFLSLNSLCAIALDAIRERPALVLQLLIFLELDAVLSDNGDGEGVERARIAIEEDLQTLADNLLGLLA